MQDHSGAWSIGDKGPNGPGPWSLVPGPGPWSLCLVPGPCPWSLVPGPLSLVPVPGPSSLVPVPGPWSLVLVPGPWSPVPGPWSLVPCPWSLVPVPGPWSLAPGPWVPGPWSLVPWSHGPLVPWSHGPPNPELGPDWFEAITCNIWLRLEYRPLGSAWFFGTQLWYFHTRGPFLDPQIWIWVLAGLGSPLPRAPLAFSGPWGPLSSLGP